jgi:hypothetical protein
MPSNHSWIGRTFSSFCAGLVLVSGVHKSEQTFQMSIGGMGTRSESRQKDKEKSVEGNSEPETQRCHDTEDLILRGSGRLRDQKTGVLDRRGGKRKRNQGFGGSMLSLFFQPDYRTTPMSHHQLEEIKGRRKEALRGIQIPSVRA